MTAISGRSGAFGVGSNAVIGDAPNASSVAGSSPITATSSSGDRRPTSPIVPTTVPIRSPELVGRHALQERGERRRDDGLTGSGHAIDARRGRWRVDQPGDEDPHERLAGVDVDVRPDEQAGALGGPASPT